MAILAGAKVDAVDVISLPHDGVLNGTVGTAAAGFTITSQGYRTALNGKLVSWTATITSTNAITATAGNITDTLCMTLDAAVRPSENFAQPFSGTVGGVANIAPDGSVELRVASDTIPAGMSFRVSATYLRA